MTNTLIQYFYNVKTFNIVNISSFIFISEGERVSVPLTFFSRFSKIGTLLTFMIVLNIKKDLDSVFLYLNEATVTIYGSTCLKK